MAEGSLFSISILGFSQTVDPVIYRNGRHIHRSADEPAGADPGHGSVNVTLCLRVHGQSVLCLEGTLVYNGADTVV